MAEEIDELMAVAKAVALTGLSDSTLRRYAYDGKVNSAKIGTRLLIPKSEVLRIITTNLRPRRKELTGGEAA
jgi:excisionase family DNA binding protein